MDRRYSEIIEPLGAHTQVTPDAATTLGFASLTLPSGQVQFARGVLIQTAVNPVRFTLDGTTPTASLGFILTPAMGTLRLDLETSTVLRIINTVAASVVDYQWFQ